MTPVPAFVPDVSLPCREFEWAAGSVRGADHERSGRQNQDAWCTAVLDDRLVAVVCDGCGSGRSSEIGAALGARLWTHALAEAGPGTPLEIVAQARARVIAALAALVGPLGGPGVIVDCLLFTTVAALVDPRRGVVFAIGDGMVAVNGELIPLGPVEGDAPPYLAYELLGADVPTQIVRELSTVDLDSLALFSDGARDLLGGARCQVPGGSDVLGPLDQLWRDDRFFTNRDALRRFFARAARSVTHTDWQRRAVTREPGLLHDDTTAVVFRRRPLR